MKVKLLKAAAFVSNNWSGGITTELFIHPSTASFKKRNFDFRLSTATVEVEKSTFTPLKGVARTLMVLEGKMALQHENHHSKALQKFDFDCFEGGWKTKSEGTCVDFNLMTRGKTKGELDGVALKQGVEFNYTAQLNFSHEYIYIHKGGFKVNWGDESFQPTTGDLLEIEHPDKSTLTLKECENSEIVVVRIY